MQNAADVPTEKKSLDLYKKHALASVIVLAINNPAPIDEFQKVCNYDDYEEVAENYKSLINQRAEEYDFSTALLGDYTSQKNQIPTFQESSSFKYKYVSEHWKDYEGYFSEIDNAEKREAVVKLTLLTIIIRAAKLQKVKRVTNL